jgi:hypothetical protein
MSEEKSREAFLGRWSRLKQQKAQEERDEQTRSPVPAAEARPEPVPAAPLPAIEDLKADSDFKPYMDPQVDAGTRRLALKKLFTDAHFNTIDPFEPYSIDLTGEDPIPEAMLKTLEHSKRMLSREKPPETPAAAEAQSTPQPQADDTGPEDVAGKQDA